MTHISVIDKCLAHLDTNVRETVGTKGIDFGFLQVVKHAITSYNTDGDPWEKKHLSRIDNKGSKRWEKGLVLGSVTISVTAKLL